MKRDLEIEKDPKERERKRRGRNNSGLEEKGMKKNELGIVKSRENLKERKEVMR